MIWLGLIVLLSWGSAGCVCVCEHSLSFSLPKGMETFQMSYYGYILCSMSFYLQPCFPLPPLYQTAWSKLNQTLRSLGSETVHCYTEHCLDTLP